MGRYYPGLANSEYTYDFWGSPEEYTSFDHAEEVTLTCTFKILGTVESVEASGLIVRLSNLFIAIFNGSIQISAGYGTLGVDQDTVTYDTGITPVSLTKYRVVINYSKAAETFKVWVNGTLVINESENRLLVDNSQNELFSGWAIGNFETGFAPFFNVYVYELAWLIGRISTDDEITRFGLVTAPYYTYRSDQIWSYPTAIDNGRNVAWYNFYPNSITREYGGDDGAPDEFTETGSPEGATEAVFLIDAGISSSEETTTGGGADSSDSLEQKLLEECITPLHQRISIDEPVNVLGDLAESNQNTQQDPTDYLDSLSHIPVHKDSHSEADIMNFFNTDDLNDKYK